MDGSKEIEILELIHESSENISQRDLAKATDLSLGLTNAILKKLATKGLLVMKRLNSRNIRYALTVEGLGEIARRSENLLKATFNNVTKYRTAIEHMVLSLKSHGYRALVIDGNFELDFIVEWACMKHDLTYGKSLPSTQTYYTTKDDLMTAIRPLLKKDRE